MLFNFELKKMISMLPRKEWTRGPGTSPVVKGPAWFRDGSRMEGTGAAVYGQSMGSRFNISLERYAKFFQAEIYAVLACA